MDALYVLLIFSLLLGLGFLAAFFFAHSRGQFDDSETPAMRILFDDHDLKVQKANVVIKNLEDPKKSENQGAHYGS